MSTTVMAACWPLQMPPTPKAVLVSLADNANDHGECWPSISKISERTCFSERAVQNAIHWLEENGVLLADRSNGRHTRYALTPEGFKPPQQVHPRTTCTPAADSKTPAAGAGAPRSRCTTPPQQVPSNRKEPSSNRKSNRQAAMDLSSWPSQPSPGVLADWLAMRKRRRADVSDTVIDAMAKQLRLAAGMGWSVDDCLTECVLRNWQGLKAEWLQPRNPHANSTTGRKLSAVEQVEQAIREQFANDPDDDFGRPFAQIGHGGTLDADG